MRLIKSDVFKEGELLCKWLNSRLIENNKNALLVFTGSTGSGKSYASLRLAELWYAYHHKKPFPIENCCFSLGQIIKLLKSQTLQRGEVIILEEAGANFGSLDYQQKLQKIFNYILQSFRSLNLCLILNLPLFTALNKTGRFLIHASFVSDTIDFNENKSIFKGYFHQVNQQMGKIYLKKLRIIYNGKKLKIYGFEFSLPDKELLKIYESHKKTFVYDLINDFDMRLEEEKSIRDKKILKKELTIKQKEVYADNQNELSLREIGEKRGCSFGNISKILELCRKKGYEVKKQHNRGRV